MDLATSKTDRIELLDALRGFALLGILLANILYWSGWSLMTDGQRLALAGAEAVTWQYRFHQLLIDGKFYTIFSLLFGVGFALQLARLNNRGQNGLQIYRRRVGFLLVIGLVHSWLVWDGDILTLYALLGFALPLFSSCRERNLLIAAAILIFVVPAVGVGLFNLLDWTPHEDLYALSFWSAERMGADTAPDMVIEWLRRKDFMGWWSWTLSGTPYSWGHRLEIWRIPKVLGIMLVGMAVGRRIAAGGLMDDRRTLRRVLVLGLAIGLPSNLFYALLPSQGQGDWPSLVGTVPLALAYAAAFVLMWPRARRWLQVFVPVGRMALTNYLTHSLLGVLIFYGIGFGLIGYLEPPAIYLVAIVIFTAQIFFSKWWLLHHQQGPAEAIWRAATYRYQREQAVII